jgi:flagellar biosynthesis protein FliR
MNFKKLNTDKLIVLYFFTFVPIVSVIMFFGLPRQDHVPTVVNAFFSLVFGAFISFAVPAVLGSVGYGIFRGIYFLCTDTKK